MNILGHGPEERPDPGQLQVCGRVLPMTTDQEASSPSPVSPSITFASRGGIVVSSLASFVYVRLHSLVFELMRRRRSRTLTVFGELLSRVLRIGRSAVQRLPGDHLTLAVHAYC
jgi:hypothetical protein